MADDFPRYRSWLGAVPPLDAERVWQRIEGRAQPSRRHSLVLAPALVGLALVAFAAGYAWMSGSPEQAGALLLADGSRPETLSAEAGPKVVALSDGSQIQLDEDARLHTRASTGTAFDTELTQGRAVFDVVPHGPRVWRVRAADVEVTVLGTRFSVELEGTFVRVSVERGTVQVSSRQLGGARILRASESVRLGVPSRVAAAPARESTRQQQKPAADSGDVTIDQDPSGASSRRAHRDSVAKRAAGADTRAKSSSIEELLHSADAARAAGQPGKAASALERAIAEHEHDPRAGLAAFTLAQLYMQQLSEPHAAARTFERAIALGLPASLAEEAMARRVEAHVRAAERVQAQRAAAAYRHSYPNGARTAAVARWLAELQ